MSSLGFIVGVPAWIKSVVARVCEGIGRFVGQHDGRWVSEASTVWLTVLSVCSWICLSGVNGPPSLRWAVVFLVCAGGAALGQPAGGALDPDRLPRSALVLWAISGAAGAALFNGPWRVSWIVLGIASLLLLVPRHRLLRPRLWLWALSRQFAMVGGLLLLLQPLWTRVHVLPGLSHLLWPLLRLSGAHVAVEGPALRLGGYPQAATITPSPQHLALDFALLMLAGLIVGGASLRTLGRFAIACILWLPLRFALLMLVAMQTTDATAFYKVAPVAVSLLPLALLTLWLSGDARESRIQPAQGRTSLRRIAVLAGVGACLGTVLLFVDPGQMKADRLLIDEAHGPWESMLVPMEDKTLDALSSYNYYWLGRWLRNYYQVRMHTEGPLTDAALADADMLMVKTPTQSYSAEEIAAIQRFVWSGGGLWLISDHTDVFGSSTYINPLAVAFGVRFIPDATYDLGYSGLPICLPPPYPAHPVAGQIRGKYMVHTSCTMQSLVGCAPMVGWAWRQVKGDYSRPHFFPGDLAKQLEFGFGSYAHCWTRAYGRGRVVACADSTIWSNFLTFIPGKSELVLGTLAWLGRSNRFTVVPRAAALLGALVLLAIGVLWWRTRRPFMIRETGWAAVTMGCLVAGMLWSRQMLVTYPEIPFRSADPIVSFEGQYSDMFLPITRYHDTFSRVNRTYSAFFVWAQRVGLVPRYSDTLSGALDAGRAVVIINPRSELAQADAEALLEFVRSGNRLLVLVGRKNGMTDASVISAANAVLRPCGLSIDATNVAAKADISFGEGDSCGGSAGSVVRGGNPIASLADGRVVGAVRQVGKGRVVVFTGASSLTAEGLGAPASKMSAQQQACARLSFMIYRALELRDEQEGPYYED